MRRKRRCSDGQRFCEDGESTRVAARRSSGDVGPEMWHVLGVVLEGTGKVVALAFN